MKRTQSIMKTKQPRRGALLLVVLSILVLFALVGLTFVVSALAFNTGAQANLERDLQIGEAPDEADAVVMQLLRGPRAGTRSVILGNEILRDMWGNQSVIVNDDSAGSSNATTILRPRDSANTPIKQLWEIEVSESVVNSTGLYRIEQYYAGSVLTFMSGELKGQSHRILQYRMKFVTTMSGTEQKVVFVIDQDPIVARSNLVDLDGNGGINPANGDDFVVNDPPFNGTGYGYNPAEPTMAAFKRSLNLRDGAGDPVALLPNMLNSFPTGLASGYSIEAGGADESYDAPDYQNMYLSFVPPGGTTTNGILPSFHRQDLIRYWVKYLADEDTAGFGALSSNDRFALFRDPDSTSLPDAGSPSVAVRDRVKAIRRKIILRPLKETHPNFTGSNPNFDIFGTATNARWDIDNDLDGLPDSIWIDVGLPLKTDRQGRRYKPLAAILIKDMDGLINLNAHGFYTQLDSFENGTFTTSATQNPAETLLLASNGMGGAAHSQFSPSWNSSATPQNMVLPLGSGYGPADVSLLQIFSAQEAFDLMHERYYGLVGSPSGTDPATPGAYNVDDSRSQMDTLGLIGTYGANGLPNTVTQNLFAVPTDRMGMGRMYFDYTGRPRYQPEVAGTRFGKQSPPAVITERKDDPYEFDLVHSNPFDSPFTYQELERIVRYEEYDSGQISAGFKNDAKEDRLLTLATSALTTSADAAKNRRLVTTSSFQVPTANRVDIPFDQRSEDSGSGTPLNMMMGQRAATARRPAPTLVTLLQERLRDANGWDPTTVSGKVLLQEKIHQLLPPEVIRGEPFDLNRLLEAPADGIDDDSNSFTDDIFELQRYAKITLMTQFNGTTSTQTPGSQFVNWFHSSTGVGASANIPTPPNWNSANPNNPTSYSMTRQLTARYLYVMTLLLMEPGYKFPRYDSTTIPGTFTGDADEELTRRRIAQWAINVVDFRDRDGVMTPFEYDYDPFTVDVGTNNDPWNVDGNLTTNTSAQEPTRRVVWGAEAPELVMTESLAFHDKRLKDTTWELATNGKKTTDPMTTDSNTDQYKIPQGSLFLEFYNPRNLASNTGLPGLPSDLYLSDGRLHLNKLTPADSSGTAGSQRPVWRVVITTSESADVNVLDEVRTRTDLINFQPQIDSASASQVEGGAAGFDMLGQTASDENYKIERVIYFANFESSGFDADTFNKEFRFRGSGAIGVFPNQYLVVGPREKTFIGSRPFQGQGMLAADPEINQDGRQYLEFTGLQANGTYTGFSHVKNLAGGPTVLGQTAIQPILGLAVSADLPDATSWTYRGSYAADGSDDPDGAPWGIGLNITEPLRNNYYDEPMFQNAVNGAPGTRFELYTNADSTTGNPVSTTDPPDPRTSNALTPDDPFDTDPSNPLGSDTIGGNSIYETDSYPDKTSQTTPSFAKGYKTAILQRVANPLSHYDPVLNPYITVDSLAIDVTVFNGEDSSTANTPPTNWADWTESQNPLSGTYHFGSRERGRRAGADLTNGVSNGNLVGTVKQMEDLATDATFAASLSNTPPFIAQSKDTDLSGDADPTRDDHFPFVPRHTLGYVNDAFGRPMNSNAGSTAVADGTYLGSPDPTEQRNSVLSNNPFTWLQWSNSPFVSKYDLMQVPSSSPQRLLFEYSTALAISQDAFNFNPLNGANPGAAPGYTGDAAALAFFGPFRHQLNFFHSSKTNGVSSANSAQLVRLFDVVHVPSRFNGTNKWFNISDFNPGSTDLRVTSSKIDDARLGYVFPFNRRSEFREPGKINLNTIPSSDVYNSIFVQEFWNRAETAAGADIVDFAGWSDFDASRRGYTGSINNSDYPSRFSNPFRSAGASEMMAELGPSSATTSEKQKLQVPPIQATILRAGDPNASSKRPLFDLKVSGSAGAGTMRHFPADNNPMLRYQAYQRLGNIAGTQSNVFATWITIGYFEVEPTTVDATHPDGWQLGQELGNDTGEVNRHRAFYIIDRSVPVGYVPGEDLNVEDTIMLKRFIE